MLPESSLRGLFQANQTSASPAFLFVLFFKWRSTSKASSKLWASSIKLSSADFLSSGAENKQVGWKRERQLRWWMAVWRGFFFLFFFLRVCLKGLGGILKACLWPSSLCPRQRNTISVQMFKVFGRAGACSPLPLIRGGNALAGSVCFLSVCGLNCRFTYISDPHLSLSPSHPPSLLVPGVSQWWAEGRTVHRSTLSPRG